MEIELTIDEIKLLEEMLDLDLEWEETNERIKLVKGLLKKFRKVSKSMDETIIENMKNMIAEYMIAYYDDIYTLMDLILYRSEGIMGYRNCQLRDTIGYGESEKLKTLITGITEKMRKSLWNYEFWKDVTKQVIKCIQDEYNRKKEEVNQNDINHVN